MSKDLKNRFRAVLQSKTVIYGLWAGLADNIAAEICAGAGFDWLVFDCEHAPLDGRTVLSCLQAVAPYDVAPMVRPIDDHPSTLKRLLDIGVQTFLVPMVNTPQQAAAIVSATRYPPHGSRGLGTSMARAARWNMTPDYISRANDEMVVIVQVETREALDNLSAIAAVDGVDCVFIGPSDLGASLGYSGAPNHEDVVNTVEGALTAVVEAGKVPGVLATTGDTIARYEKAGARFIGVGSDTGLLAKGAQALAKGMIGGAGRVEGNY